MTNTHTDIQETIAAYTLDAMAPAERDDALPGLLDHVAGCADCREVFNDYREVAGDLALGAPPIPVSAGLEARVMGAIRGEPQALPARSRRSRWMTRALMAASLAAVAALGAVSFTAVSDLRDQRAVADRTTRALALVTDPSAQRFVLTGSGEGSISMAVASDGAAVLVGSGLQIESGRVFELWLMRDGTPVPAGVFTPKDGVALLLLDEDPRSFDAAAVTIESGPNGSRAPTTDVIFSTPLRA